MGVCGGCAKALLIIFNFIFWLSGIAILGVGIWMIVDKNIASYFEVVNIDSHDKFFRYSAYMLMAFGVFVLLVGFCGCCGAIRGSKCLLGLYIFFLFLIFAGELAAGVLMIVYKVEIEDKISGTLKKSISEEYGKSTTITDAWNIVQIQMECCGGEGPVDYNDSTFQTQNPGKELPVSCCVLSNKEEAEEDPKKAKPVNLETCQLMNVTTPLTYHDKGCEDELLSWAQKHSIILIGVGIGIACLEIFGIVFAICLCREVDLDKY